MHTQPKFTLAAAVIALVVGFGVVQVSPRPDPTSDQESTKSADIPAVVSIWSGSALKSPPTSCGVENPFAQPLKKAIEL